MRTRDMKALAEEYEEQYDEAMIDDLKDAINDYLDGLPADTVNPDTMYEIVEAWSNALPEVWSWCHDQVQSDIDDYADAKHEQMRDERMGL